MRYAISYISTASNSVNKDEIKELLNKSEKRNDEKEITGLLLYSEGHFFQIIEGEKQEVSQLYNKIINDQRHSDVIKLFETEIKREAFDGYKSDMVSESSGYNISTFKTYSNYLEILSPQKRNAVENLLKAFIR